MPSDSSLGGHTPHVPLDQPDPQAVLNPLTTSATFLVLTVPGDQGSALRVLTVATDVNGLVRAVGFREPSAELSCVVGFGASFWDRIRPAGAPRPAQLHTFPALTGVRRDAPSTPGDLLFHVRANRADIVFEFTRQLMDALGSDVHVEDHTTGLRYFDSRDLLGFVDGTENPTGRGATTAALIGATQEPDFTSGSYVTVQKYLHDMDAWKALSTEEQERVIGRTKLDDIELPDDVKPTNSHVALNSVTDEDGNERDILRDNMAFGDPSRAEMGTYYIAYASDLAVTEEMMRNMFIGNPPGNYDRILDVSTPVTGTEFFVPSLDLLESLADDAPSRPEAPADEDATTPVTADTDGDDVPGPPITSEGSLSIGSLRGTES